ncbi:MAG: aminoacetone oxidase family FAD-binding enzyme, partial [Methanogenium sp.]|nr:aminoacetone oxidase family FAD-binding enzyme [Methanogenium sp.]
TKKSSDVLEVLLSECKKRGVEIHCNETVHDLAIKDGRFILKSGVAEYHADNLVIATGGASYPATGSSGDGYALARQLGQTITEISPGLSPAYIEDYHFSDLSGISFENISLSLFKDNKKISQQRGDLLFTHTGLSGPGVLDLSRYIAPGDLLKISFIPDMDTETFRKDLTERFQANQTKQVKTILSEYSLPERFVKRILELTEIPPELTCAHLSKKLRNRLIMNLTELPFRVKKLAGFEKAMVTRGGVSLGRINQKSMESQLVPHLWFIGEVLDIDGDTGGYNLQAAFSTAMLAAEHILSEENPERMEI